MKNSILAIIAICTFTKVVAQEITGAWHGLLSVQGTQLPLTFNVDKTADSLKATIDSPEQKALGIPVARAIYKDSTLTFLMPDMGAEYRGKLTSKNIFVGNFTQRGRNFPMNLSREKAEKTKINRPQEPLAPYPYYTEEIKFKNEKEKITLAGTLTLPKKEGKFPVVILISGSGPQNRNEELMGHKPFLVLADHLTKNGIGVLRYDDRGTNESEGDFSDCNSQNFAYDVEAAIKYLLTRKEIDKTNIGLIGHSEGGLIAPIVASKNKNVAFIVLLAGPGMSGGDILLLQQELIGRATGISEKDLAETKSINTVAYQIISKSKDIPEAKKQLAEYYKKTISAMPEDERPTQQEAEEGITTQINAITGKWMYFFIKYNPYPNFKNVKCPVLALNGEKDLQVPSKENLVAIKKGIEMGKNKNVTTKELPNMNHLFQECKTGSPSEYATIEQTISPIALNEVSTWILNVVK
jgi:pimeloyl-ACP methyl ester carboxylesterase